MIRKDQTATPADRELEALRELLLEREHVRLERIERVLDEDRLEPEAISKVLPKAFLLSQDDKTLNYALAKPVENALQRSVRKNPAPLAEAIHPVIGPAIRKAVSNAISSMVQNFNAALEHSFSPRSLKWRFDAWRTGKSFSEIVLLKSLVFRVEQVFLIHRETSLLLRHIAAPEVNVKDADMVSAMLSAIQDFVRDSFDASEQETVRTMKVGDTTVWAEQGPKAVIAVTLRGTPPAELRGVMARALERSHVDMADELAEFSGDTEAFAAVEPHLESCLLQATKKKNNDVRNTVLFFVLLVVITAIGFWIVRSVQESRRWSAFLSEVREEPGLVVTETGERDGKRMLVGLRDPLAVDPSTLLGKLDPADVDLTWRPYRALHPDIAVKRARQTLAPPDGVQITVQDGRIRATGSARHAWVERARLLGATLGVPFDLAATDLDAEEYAAAARRVAAYDSGIAGLEGIRAELRTALDRAHTLGVRAHVDVTGTGDAEAVTRLLATGSFAPGEIRTGSASAGPLRLRIIGTP